MATLRPPVLEERGLVSTLCDYAYLVKGCSGGLVLDTIEQPFQAAR
jgi:hypothetical protein